MVFQLRFLLILYSTASFVHYPLSRHPHTTTKPQFSQKLNEENIIWVFQLNIPILIEINFGVLLQLSKDFNLYSKTLPFLTTLPRFSLAFLLSNTTIKENEFLKNSTWVSFEKYKLIFQIFLHFLMIQTINK